MTMKGPPMTKQQRAALEGRRIKSTTRQAIELCLAGESLRAAASRAGCHPSTVHEAIKRHGLDDDWKRARAKRLCQDAQGDVPAVWARHFTGVRRPAWVQKKAG